MRSKAVRMLALFSVLIVASGCGATTAAPKATTTAAPKAATTTAPKATTSSKPVLKVGLLFPLTGAFSLLGTEMYHGVLMGLQQVNSAGGVDGAKIRIFSADSQSNPQVAATQAQNLITQDHIQVLMGSYASSLSQSISTVAERNHVVMWEVGAVANSLTEQGYKYYFRSVGNATSYAVADMGFLNNDVLPALKMSKSTVHVAVAYENDAFGTSVGKSLVGLLKKEDGITPVAVESYPASTTNLAPTILRLKAAKPDVLFLTPLVSDGLLFYQTMRTDNFNVKVLVGSAGFSAPGFLQKFGAKGIQDVFDVEPPNASGLNPTGLSASAAHLLKTFISDYKAKYGHDPLIHAGLGYFGGWLVGTKLLPAAVKLADGGTPTEAQIRQAALSVDVPAADSPLGYGVKFSSSGNDTLGQSMMMQWQNGKLVVVYPSKLAQAKPQIPMPTWSQR